VLSVSAPVLCAGDFLIPCCRTRSPRSIPARTASQWICAPAGLDFPELLVSFLRCEQERLSTGFGPHFSSCSFLRERAPGRLAFSFSVSSSALGGSSFSGRRSDAASDFLCPGLRFSLCRGCCSFWGLVPREQIGQGRFSWPVQLRYCTPGFLLPPQIWPASFELPFDDFSLRHRLCAWILLHFVFLALLPVSYSWAL
jgi:hypothetical protein